MIERLSITMGNDELTFETGRIGKQAQGAVLVEYGETMVLSAACVSPEPRLGQDFFPLTVDYREKSSSAGKIPGNFFRREGRPSEREILVCRLTDRPLRPLFPNGFINEVQVCSTVYSADNEHDPDVMSINGASAALHISPIPFDGPIGAVRVGMFDGQPTVNPAMARMAESQLDLVIAGTNEAIVMVEGQAKEVPEDRMLEALEFGHGHIRQICEAIETLRARVGIEKMQFDPPEIPAEVVDDVEAMAAQRLEAELQNAEKQRREEAVAAVRADVDAQLLQKYGEEVYAERSAAIAEVFHDLERRIMRAQVLRTKRRIDGRDLDTVRPISIEVGVLPRAHGSCLFTRGETQALVTTTLGTSRDEQRLDELTGEEFRRFMLHYNFPPWSVGEVRFIRGPGRREIGHGKLAERAIEAVVPFEAEEELDPDATPEFPYTVRVVSDITESNGSSSMASVCGGTLSLMDAGVPIAAPVAGVAMGLIKEGDEACILTDILGAEDHLGDMDFKVCGTRAGVTAFQMDVKTKGIARELMTRALEQARTARLHILGKMAECLAAPRPEISKYAPRIYTIKIDVEKIREVIGPGGKIIRHIQAVTGADIDIQDDGTVNVAAVDQASADAAIAMIEDITADVEVGKIYRGVVTRIVPIGAFVSVLNNKEGLVHISELAPRRVGQVSDVVQVGDEVDVKVTEIDPRGRINMSKVAADSELGRLTSEEEEERMKSRSRASRPRRDRDRSRDDRNRNDRSRSRRNRDRR